MISNYPHAACVGKKIFAKKYKFVAINYITIQQYCYQIYKSYILMNIYGIMSSLSYIYDSEATSTKAKKHEKKQEYCMQLLVSDLEKMLNHE